MKQSIRGSDVFIKEDLRAILDALDIAARHQPAGQFADGWLAATAAMRTAIGIRTASPLDDWRVVDNPQSVEVRP